MSDFADIPPGMIVPAESDARIANNATRNAARHNYRLLTEAEKARVVALKDAAAAFIALCKAEAPSREIAPAITNAEQAAMWAVRHVAA